MSRPKILQDLKFDPETNDIYRIVVGRYKNSLTGTTKYEKMMIVKVQVDKSQIINSEFVYKLKPCTDETLI